MKELKYIKSDKTSLLKIQLGGKLYLHMTVSKLLKKRPTDIL